MIVHIIDAWNLTSICRYSLPEQLVDLCAQTYAASTRMLVLCGEDQVLVWDIGDVTEFLAYPSSKHLFDPRPNLKLIMGSAEKPSKIALTTDACLLAVAYEYLISFVHESWVISIQFRAESRNEAYLSMTSKVVSLMFTDESFVVTLEDGQITEFDLDKLLHNIGIGDEGPRVLTRRNTLGSVFNITDKARRVSLRDIMHKQVPVYGRRLSRRHTMEVEARTKPPATSALGFMVKQLSFNEDYFYFAKKNSLFVCELDSILKEKFEISTLSMQKCRPEYLADCQLQFLLSPDETVTDSHLVMAHSWPLYVVGTSKGRVFIVPLSVTRAIMTLEGTRSEAISAILYYHDTLVSCSQEGTVQCWSLAPQDLKSEEDQSTITCNSSDSGQRIDLAPRSPSVTFSIPYSDVRVMKQPHAIREVLDKVPEHLWKEKWTQWQHMIVGQVEDETVILLSMEEKEVVCAFYGMKGGLREALVHLLLDYLYLNCGDGDCYVINMVHQQVERIVPSFSIPFRSAVAHHMSEPSLPDSPTPHQLLQFSINSLAAEHGQALAWVESVSLGKAQFPVLFINAGNIAESFSDTAEFPEQAEFILSLLSSWAKLGEEEEKLQTQLQLLFQIQKPAVAANVGTFGVDNALSFSLPGKKSRWEISGYISAVQSASLLSVLNACSHFKPSLKPLIHSSVGSHFARLKDRVRHFKRPCPVVLGFEVIGGNLVAYDLLRTALPLFDTDELMLMMDEWRQIFVSTVQGASVLPLSPKDGIAHWKTFQPARAVSSSEALSAVMIAALSLNGVKTDLQPDILSTFENMLKGDSPGYIIAASLLLHDGIKRWRADTDKSTYNEVVVALLRLHHASTRKVRYSTRKALLYMGKADVATFCDSLKHEVVKVSGDREYPESVLMVLEALIYKHSSHLLMDLQALVDVVLRAIDSREILLRKICLSKATDTLDLLVKCLPMVAFDRSRQLLAVGTNARQVVIYELKTANVWRELQAHEGPVSALCFSTDGSFLASYSLRDSQLRIWRLGTGFLGLGSLEIRSYSSISLPSVQSIVVSSRDLIKTISLAWRESQGVQLVREDGVGYCYTVE